ncbi:hypothetical protein RND71_027947 [Anisodus tanguticus]|uniref:SLC26A/SulP transporter domain-containing protein n=1 Tax=Anisodus tanguticus TaxID=243964 RepID=A0AAE1RJT5_9SOLA|nr:hypothetical protein RND71_027947 [Anisodus tanguticus]
MGSLANESFNIELQQLDAANDTARKQRTQWLLTSPNPPSTKFKHDIMAGLTLASLCIPQTPVLFQMGSSRGIAIGPVAVVSLLLSAMVPKIAVDHIDYRNLVFTATFFIGAFQAVFGLFRLGFLVDFVSHAAIIGFMGGAAIVIGLQQLKGLLGIKVFTTKTDVVSVLEAVYKSLHNEPGKRNKKMFWLPAIAPLISVVLSTLIVYLTKADQHGVKVVKHFKGGLNPSSLHQLQFNSPHIGELAKIGLVLSSLSLSVSTLCSFSRTAVNFSAGCETVVSNIVMAITVLISLRVVNKAIILYSIGYTGINNHISSSRIN